MKKTLIAFIGLAILSSCEDLAIEKEDVVRFDRKIVANDSVFSISGDSVIRPYETEELKKYKDERDAVVEYKINKVDFLFSSFRADNDSSLILGRAYLTSNQGTEFSMQLFEDGDEYKDGKRHEIHELRTSDGKTGGEAYDALAEEVINADEFTLNTGELTGIKDSLDCNLSIYIEYTIKANK